jgi:hypothetical protein
LIVALREPIFTAMTPELTSDSSGKRIATWSLPFAATLGSLVRAKGIFQATRLRLPSAARKALNYKSSELTLDLPAPPGDEALVAAVTRALDGIEARQVLPREIEDILGIKPTERHRWLKDGRLKSAGTKTVKLRGRGTITFHVFDPDLVEDLLNREAVIDWREADKAAAAENRRRAAWKAKQAKWQKANGDEAIPPGEATVDESGRPNLRGWEEFERNGLLR